MATEDSTPSERLKTTGGLLGVFIFILSFELCFYLFYMILVLVDRKSLIHHGWSIRIMNYQFVVALVHTVVLFFLVQLILQRRKIAIKYMKIALVVSAIFRIVLDPLINRAVDPSVQVAGARVWERAVLGLIIPFIWYQYFRKSERVRLTLVE